MVSIHSRRFLPPSCISTVYIYIYNIEDIHIFLQPPSTIVLFRSGLFLFFLISPETYVRLAFIRRHSKPLKLLDLCPVSILFCILYFYFVFFSSFDTATQSSREIRILHAPSILALEIDSHRRLLVCNSTTTIKGQTSGLYC